MMWPKVLVTLASLAWLSDGKEFGCYLPDIPHSILAVKSRTTIVVQCKPNYGLTNGRNNKSVVKCNLKTRQIVNRPLPECGPVHKNAVSHNRISADDRMRFRCNMPVIPHAKLAVQSQTRVKVQCLPGFEMSRGSSTTIKCNPKKGAIVNKRLPECVAVLQADEAADTENIVVMLNSGDEHKIAYETEGVEDYYDGDAYNYEEALTGPGQDYGQYYDYEYEDFTRSRNTARARLRPVLRLRV